MSPDVANSKLEIEQLCRRFHVKRLHLFGSAASGGEHNSRSDLDFLVEFRPLRAGAYANNYFGLLESFERLFDRPVDLVVPSAIENPYFLQSVEETKILLYAA